MKKLLLFTSLVTILSLTGLNGQDILITGVMDGDLSGGLPKMIELYVINDIADMATIKISMASNGAAVESDKFTFPTGPATAGTFFTVANGSAVFNTYMGYEADYYTTQISGNGNDVYLVKQNGSIVDIFGELGVDGTGTAWEYIDGYAYRKNYTGPDGTTFNINNWMVYKLGLDGFATNAAATVPFPFKSYIHTLDETPPVWTDGYPTLTNIMDTRGDLTVNLNEPGTVYFMVLYDGQTEPTAEQVKAGVPYADVTPLYPGSFTVEEALTNTLFVIAGADPETAYDIYVVAEDESGNLQATTVKFDVTTAEARVLEITSPQEKDTYNTGEEVTFTWLSANISQIYIGGYDYRHLNYFYITEDGNGNPVPIDATTGTYSFTIPNDAALDSLAIIMWDVADTTFFDMVTPVYIADILPPGIDYLWPVNEQTNLPVNVQPEIYFEEEVFAGTGKLYIREIGGTLFEEFDIAAAGPGQSLEFIDNDYGIRITPTTSLAEGTTYYIEIDAGMVKDYFDNDFAGITGSTTWSFSTETTTAVETGRLENMKIYPVPLSSTLTIEYPDGLLSVEILDMTGTRIYRNDNVNSSRHRVDVSPLPTGIYLLRMNTASGLVTRKIIKR